MTTNYTYNSRDQLLTEVSPNSNIVYSYDDNGRQVSKDVDGVVTTYEWEDRDRLARAITGADTLSYQYDYEGRRVSSTSDGVTTNYLIDPTLPYGQTVADYGTDGSEIASYVYGLERISQDRSGEVRWFIYDGQGNVRTLTDENADYTDNYGWTAFGEELYKGGTTENRFGYTGEAFDAGLGYQYLRARWMDNSTGRFLGMDAFGGDPMAPVSLHRYLYANQSPLSFYDPTGHFSIMDVTSSIGIQGQLSGLQIGFGSDILDHALGQFAKADANQGASSEKIYNFMNSVQTVRNVAAIAGLAGVAYGVRSIFRPSLWKRLFKKVPYASFNKLPTTGRLNPNYIRFSQNDISVNFRNGAGNVEALAAKLKSGSVNVGDIPPIRIVEKDGLIYTLDNRRLYAFQKAGIKIPYVKLDYIPKNQNFKFTTNNNGASIEFK